MASISDRPPLDRDVLDAIAERLSERVLARLETADARHSDHSAFDPRLSVAQVAELLGVARSTVYAHWREWGGFKLGNGAKAPIRFSATALPGGENLGLVRDTSKRSPSGEQSVRSATRRSSKRRRDLVTDAPRFGNPIGSAS